MTKENLSEFRQTKDDFIAQWGAMGSAWGINRTMAQVHALLMVTEGALSTDEIMADLKISRGNAHGNLRELVGWGLVRSVIRKGERKEFFEAQKDVWKIFCIITRERKRREIEPVLNVLKECQQRSKGMKGPEEEAFRKQVKALTEFVGMANDTMERIANSSENQLAPIAIKFLKKGKS